MTVFHVATTGSDSAAGSASAPLRTINAAAALAQPGDTVRVHEGEYREWVTPARGGRSDRRRITYEAAAGERVVIKGSERIAEWAREDGTVWRAEVPNALFGRFNPFAEEVGGDWLVHPPHGRRKHLGDVYLNGRSFYEVDDPAAVSTAPARSEAVDGWTGLAEPVLDVEQTRYVWSAEVGEESTTIWANFQGADPTVELVEINVRRSVFYPMQHHLDYITVRGFEMAQAATPWAPPTADQPGLIGPNWAKGWIIEDNLIHDSKCSAISLGKEASTGHNYATLRGDKPGYQYQLESVFSARQAGWDREHIGSHTVRRNTIFDCGQNGIVGHLGAVFSIIEDNHIHHIATKREFYGYEIAGIKLHAAIDVQIRHNRIDHCTLGAWLDWQTQGTRVARNLFYANTRDLFVEVSHGPYMVDHNVLASRVALEVWSQGGAYVNNLVAGAVRLDPVIDRATPYHRPHSTQVSGYAVICGGDDRYIGNMFLGGDAALAYRPGSEAHERATYGTQGYDGYPATFAAYLEEVNATSGDHKRFHGVKQPAYIHHNAYANGAAPYEGECDAVVTHETVSLSVVEEGGHVHLEVELPDALAAPLTGPVAGRDLPRVRLADGDFEEPDGSPVALDTDLLGHGKEQGTAYPAGPLATLSGGSTRIRVW
ncbi:right-handed parallel beta-helix repeat-containing protein [Nocardioides sp.]|uniref:right-handed parallel beta-helix repeat-containing protein n=1 Tax=Nocardioides sp. TaxID=35761 RepID=UPI002D810F22|nr:right-handed parallel beta-helix repeat-containing protein [Nocardioides sp.]HET8960862.1 right-handed parallel beta-helix repeat-containing protein [Nocardioides sp.]